MFISIIIPVYNAEKYIDECLQSCLNQDIPKDEYEIIFVNDGSKDKSPEILQSYAEKYPNIISINRENGGVSAARNTGLDAAKGDYIWFVDADDMIGMSMLEKIKSFTAENTCDILKLGEGKNFYFFMETLKESEKLLPPNTAKNSDVVCANCFRRKFLLENSLRFREGVNYGEDTMFVLEADYRNPTRKVLPVNTTVLFRRNNSESAEANMKKRRLADSDIAAAKAMKPYYDETCRNDDFMASRIAVLYLNFVRKALISIAKLPKKEKREKLKVMKNSGIYPLRFTKKLRKNIWKHYKNKMFSSKLYCWLYIKTASPLGFAMLSVLKNRM